MIANRAGAEAQVPGDPLHTLAVEQSLDDFVLALGQTRNLRRIRAAHNPREPSPDVGRQMPELLFQTSTRSRCLPRSLAKKVMATPKRGDAWVFKALTETQAGSHSSSGPFTRTYIVVAVLSDCDSSEQGEHDRDVSGMHDVLHPSPALVAGGHPAGRRPAPRDR